ncbi:MAG TPA: amidohydrolase family protein [Candidatus Binatia bacterium]|nr:amidohydrolase family protein [Candidatus Binatia bacterium]
MGARSFFAALTALAFAVTGATAQTTATAFATTQGLEQDTRITAILDDLRAAGRRGFIAIINARIVDPESASLIEGQTILVRGERIVWTGPSALAPDFGGAFVIDAAGSFVAPGIADMHVHTTRMGQHVLRLAAGVTTTRDMVGAPWMLRLRDAIAADRMIGSTDYVMGTILADRPLYGYAIVVRTEAEARAAVRQQAACGYGAIKIHNNLSLPLLNAIADEADHVGLDLIGHVPHDTPIEHVVQSAGARTLEHLKGFLNDRNFLPSEEDFSVALRRADVWITPTFYTRLDRAYGEEAAARAADPRQRYAPRSHREYSIANVPAPGSRDQFMYDRKESTIANIMPRLLPLRPRWLVGTDAAGYPFNIAGFAAHDEMLMMREEGIADADIVRAASFEAAAALREEREFGAVRAGQRADLLLLAANPLQDVAAYAENRGVMARGRWYDRAALDAALERLAAIYDEPPLSSFTQRQASALAAALERETREGFVFDARAVREAAQELEAAGHTRAAQRLRAIAAIGVDGVCATEQPEQ